MLPPDGERQNDGSKGKGYENPAAPSDADAHCQAEDPLAEVVESPPQGSLHARLAALSRWITAMSAFIPRIL